MNCQKCGAVVGVGEQFCAMCGKPLQADKGDFDPAKAQLQLVASRRDKAAGLLALVACFGQLAVGGWFAWGALPVATGLVGGAVTAPSLVQWLQLLLPPVLLCAGLLAAAGGVRSVMSGRGRVLLWLAMVAALLAFAGGIALLVLRGQLLGIWRWLAPVLLVLPALLQFGALLVKPSGHSQ